MRGQCSLLQVTHHASHHGELLIILFSEERKRWAHHLEEFQDNGGDTSEVALPAEGICNLPRHAMQYAMSLAVRTDRDRNRSFDQTVVGNKDACHHDRAALPG
jgi:hypothetical protein